MTLKSRERTTNTNYAEDPVPQQPPNTPTDTNDVPSIGMSQNYPQYSHSGTEYIAGKIYRARQRGRETFYPSPWRKCQTIGRKFT